MATNSLPSRRSLEIADATTGNPVMAVAESVVRALASLKLTVTLLFLGILLVLFGTLAQFELSSFDVTKKLFRTAITTIQLQWFFPPTFFPNKAPVHGSFPFPGGWLIGVLMGVNLLAAHGLRFKVQASGKRLWWGIAVIALGIGAIVMVVLGGNNAGGVSDAPLLSWDTIWHGFLGSIAAAWVVLFGLLIARRENQGVERGVILTSIIGLGVLLGALIYFGEDARLSDSSMRIFWQLAKATFASAILLVGSILVFRKRAGIVVIHAGIGLMIFNEWFVSKAAVETQMGLWEKQTTNWVQDIRTTELAIVEQTDAKHQHVVVVPQHFLEEPGVIDEAELPFKIRVLKFHPNSDLTEPDKTTPPPLEHLVFLSPTVQQIKPAKPISGASSDQRGDYAAVEVEFLTKDDQLIEKRLLSVWHSQLDMPIEIATGGKSYQTYLRPKRVYKPYTVELIDVTRQNYLGTNTPRDYASEIRLVDDSRGVNLEKRVWMNNPLRYAGETFYQSGHFEDSETHRERTTISIVANSGWMIPYVACMIVVVGLFWHFRETLLRFLRRRREELERTAKAALALNIPIGERFSGWLVRSIPALLIATVFLGYAAWLAVRAGYPVPRPGAFDWAGFGRIGVVYEGRCKPIDSVARNSLRVIAGSETVKDEQGPRLLATQWLLDVITNNEKAHNYEIFKITNPDVLDFFKITRRESGLYSLNELRKRAEAFDEAIATASKKNKEELGHFERAILDLRRRTSQYLVLQASFEKPAPPPDLQVGDIPAWLQHAKDRAMKMESVLAIPLGSEASNPFVKFDAHQENWLPYSIASLLAELDSVVKRPANPAALAWKRILEAYAANDVDEFNAEVASYRSLLKQLQPRDYSAGLVDFEAFFNDWRPFYWGTWVYLAPLAIACLGLAVFPDQLNRIAFWLLASMFLIHLAALIGRIAISGRPPVTNLYSSAVFIGWACVLASLIFEKIFRLGLGIIVGGFAGFITLWISDYLSFDGDTFTVMQAVLDTQIWLATHVVCITLGYAATFVAGMFGVLYILLRLLSPHFDNETQQLLTKKIYGTLCFALFFSFFGTVLGGLWADDSWGRFWGWDPKENGALIIVLWNAIVLHARWDGMVKTRGLAVLAVGGNIVTGWSWFGVNQLGIGLHSYGFTEGVIKALMVWVAFNLGIMALGLLPESMCLSRKRPQGSDSDAITAKAV